MGTDYLNLFDRKTAGQIIAADAAALPAILASCIAPPGEKVLSHYWDSNQAVSVPFEPDTSLDARFRIKLQGGASLEHLKEVLLWELCYREKFLYLDYWGCAAEVFGPNDPPGATAWDDYTAPIRSKPFEELHFNSAYLLTDENITAILRGLDIHTHELTIMEPGDVDRIRQWQTFCRTNPDFCVVYQIDF